MLQSHVIDIDGAFVGAAVRLDNGYRFIATDMKLDDLDGSIWPTLADVQRLARRIYLGGRVDAVAGALTRPLAQKVRLMTKFPVSRRGLLSAAGVAVPLGLIGPRVFAGNRIAIPDSLMAPPICKAAAPCR